MLSSSISTLPECLDVEWVERGERASNRALGSGAFDLLRRSVLLVSRGGRRCSARGIDLGDCTSGVANLDFDEGREADGAL